MKNLIIILLAFISIFGYSQIPAGDHIEKVKKETLKNAKLMSEIIPNYPSAEWNKTINYVSVDIEATASGKKEKATSKTDQLTEEQKALLARAEVDSTIWVDIKFTYKDPGNDNLGGSDKIKSMSFLVKVIN